MPGNQYETSSQAGQDEGWFDEARSRSGRPRSGHSGPAGVQERAERQERSGRSHGSHTAKVVEMVCSSSRSFDDAITCGLRDAAENARHITGAEVASMTMRCDGANVLEYRVTLKVAFGVERPGQGSH